MKAKNVIDEFFNETGLEKVNDIKILEKWLEKKFHKKLNRPLIFSKGCGGGQTYRMFWNTFDDEGNANTPSYYFVCKGNKIQRLEKNKHEQLQVWIDSPTGMSVL